MKKIEKHYLIGNRIPYGKSGLFRESINVGKDIYYSVGEFEIEDMKGLSTRKLISTENGNTVILHF